MSDGTLLTDEEIIDHHVTMGCEFGNTSPVEVVQQALLKTACGWHNGYTVKGILEHHGLISVRKGRAKLTGKGKLYLWEVFKSK